MRNFFEKYKDKKYVLTNLNSILLIIIAISTIFNILSIHYLENIFISMSNNIAIGLNKTIDGIKYMNDNYSGTLGFLGSIIGGALGFIGAISVSVHQCRLENKKEKDRLMLLLVSTYDSMKFILMDSDAEGKILTSQIRNNLVRDSDWSKYLVQIQDFNDSEIIYEWFDTINDIVNRKIEIEKKNGERCQVAINKKIIEDKLDEIKKILIKYKYEEYLKQSEDRISKEYKEKLITN